MTYRVTRKYVPPVGGTNAPGEHYTLINEAAPGSFLYQVTFYRTAKGREVATDKLGFPLAQDGEIFRQVKAAVDTYDEEG
jgi:hypothetical protein